MILRLLLLSVLLYACSGPRRLQTDLYFGQLKPDGGMVSEQQWNEFMDQHISRVFPQGSTVLSATGRWYDTAAQKLISEPSHIVTTIHPQSPKLDRQIDSLRALYKVLHQQQSVLRVDRKVKAWF